MERKKLFRLTLVLIMITYFTLLIIVDDFGNHPLYYQSMWALAFLAFVVNFMFGKNGDDTIEGNKNSSTPLSRRSKLIVLSFTMIIMVFIIWLLGVIVI